MNLKQLFTAAFALMLTLGLGNVATAQPGGGQGQPPGGGQGQPPAAGQQQGTQMSSEDFSDEELQSFIDVQTDLQTVRTEYSAKLEETDDPEEAAQLQEEASQEMVGVLEESNLDVEKYNQIAMTLQQDEELLQRVQSMLEEEQG